jgi:hypothetical protein
MWRLLPPAEEDGGEGTLAKVLSQNKWLLLEKVRVEEEVLRVGLPLNQGLQFELEVGVQLERLVFGLWCK